MSTLRGRTVTLNLPSPPVAYYRHGWQSWSLACWHDPRSAVPIQTPTILHPLQTDPSRARRTDPNGSWLGAVRFANDSVLLLGGLGTDAGVELEGDQLRGHHDGHDDDFEWFVGRGDRQTVFQEYAEALGERLGSVAKGRPRSLPARGAPRVWCSWYSLYTGISEEALSAVVANLGDLPFDTIQVDDGWQRAVGDWQPNEKFPSGMAALANSIRATGRRAGLWLAPLIATASSRLAREHRDWLLHDKSGKLVSAGFNWGEQLFAIDTTHPDALGWITGLMQAVREWGFDYLKLDFLYGGALPGTRYADVPREAAYRTGLMAMREAMGDAYFVACGAPIIPSVGMCDALRIGPDVAGHWESTRDERYLANPAIPGTRNAIRTCINRMWLSSLVTLDPDVVYIGEEGENLTDEQRLMLQALAQVCGFIATSDLPDPACHLQLRELLTARPTVRAVGAYAYEIAGSVVDFKPALDLPGGARGIDLIVSGLLSWVGNRRLVLRIMDGFAKRAYARRTQRYLRSIR